MWRALVLLRNATRNSKSSAMHMRRFLPNPKKADPVKACLFYHIHDVTAASFLISTALIVK